MNFKDALLLLGFEPEARPTLDAARDRYRELALRHHPDRGGAAEEFARLGDAWEVAKVELSKPRLCLVCEGIGYGFEVRGFHAARVRCSACGGTGQAVERDG